MNVYLCQQNNNDMKIQTIYTQVLNMLATSDYNVAANANAGSEIEHFLFVVKSEYMLGQLSTKLNVIKHNGLFFAVDNNGVLYFEIAMNEQNEILRITNQSYNRIENSL